MTYKELRDKAINETKIGGNSQKAMAFAILTLAQAVQELDGDGLQQAVKEGLLFIGDSIESR